MNVNDGSKLTKKQRHSCITKLISESAVETQGQLTEALIRYGFDVTQATVSRDIKELRLIKVADSFGRYCYAFPENEANSDVLNRYSALLKHAAVSVRAAQNLVVIRTLPGSAQGCAMAIETLRLKDVIGTIAGDDTIFVAAENSGAAEELAAEMSAIIE